MRILTDKRAWKAQFDGLSSHDFFYADLHQSPQALLAQCIELNIEAILCFDYTAHVHHAPSRKWFKASGVPWLYPELHAAQMEDKFIAVDWFKTHGFERFLPLAKKADDFPYVLKSANGMSGEFVHFVENAQQLEQLQIQENECLLQEYIVSPFEYAHHVLACEGEILESVTYEHDFRDKLTDSKVYIRGHRVRNSRITRHDLSAKHREVFKEIIQTLNYSGLGCFDFKLKDNRLYLIELNARMGGSLLFYDEVLGDFNRFLMRYRNALFYSDKSLMNSQCS